MGVENNNYDNNINPEVKNFTSDKKLSSEEAKFLLEVYEKNKNSIIIISKENLVKLREIIGSESEISAIVKGDLDKLREIREKEKIVVFSKPQVSNTSKVLHSKKIEKNNNLSDKLTNKNFKDYAALVLAEAKGEGEEGMIAVANVIKNRMEKWGKSIEEVLFAKTGKGKHEFSPFDDGRFKVMKKQVTDENITLVKNVLNGNYDPTNGATFFQNKEIEKKVNTWQEKATKQGTLKKTVTIGNHIFRTDKHKNILKS